MIYSLPFASLIEPSSAILGVVSVGVVNVLFVKVCVPVKVTTVLSIANVTVSPETEVSIPVPPVNVSVSVPNTTPSSDPESAAISNVVVIDAVPAAVKRPCASTVNVGIAVAEPYDPADTDVSSKSIEI